MAENTLTPDNEAVSLANTDSFCSEASSMTDGNSARNTPQDQHTFSPVFGKKGIAMLFKGYDNSETQTKSVPFRCSPSPTLTRDFNQRRKTILNTFCLSAKTKYDRDIYKLYHHTISKKADQL